ncbi:MAG: exodeoxyribonuclease VII large subunit [Spirulina sp. SIO3F2]|nr:exodeoxyribonuclease VII large subunit [Spirulina sp. SIO3F2]
MIVTPLPWTEAFSVGGLTDYLKLSLEAEEQLQHCWIWGEVTSCKDHPSGLFFTLTDPEQAAAIQCVVWGGLRQHLQAWPRLGTQVVVFGSLGLYPKRSTYQLKVVQVRTVGAGLQAHRLQQLRSRLAAEGLFDPLSKRKIPANPQIIAVVTSPTAAAWGDIQRTLHQRQPNVQVLFSPAIVQGEQAPDAIAQALARIERDDRAQVILLARGGGATEDLACFNDERVVRAIFDCQRPVVTGIGHEQDQSLADLVADVAVHTPTAAAELIVPDAQQRYREHVQRKTQLVRGLARQLAQAQADLTAYQGRLRSLSTQARSLTIARTRQQLLEAKLRSLDPQAVLRRGYALVQAADSAQTITHRQQLELGQTLNIKLAHGQATVKVESIG